MSLAKERIGMKQVEIRVEVPEDNGYKGNPALMKRVDEHLKQAALTCCALVRDMEPGSDGSWKLKVSGAERSIPIIEKILTTHYGFKVVSRTECD